MKCKICESKTQELFEAKILSKYMVQYYQCEKCNFIQTEHPHWLEEAYSDAITALDIGLVARNYRLADFLSPLLHKHFGEKSFFLDYGGGYGIFVRLMRDRGLNFYRQDLYCENLFAKHFDIGDLKEDIDFALLTTFEVFEHLDDPIIEIEKMFKHSPSILFSTTLLPPNAKFKDVMDWSYFTPETGQHIALYSIESLQEIAKRFNKKLYTDGVANHLLTDKSLPKNILKKSIFQKVSSRVRRYRTTSLLPTDLKMIKDKIRNTP